MAQAYTTRRFFVVVVVLSFYFVLEDALFRGTYISSKTTKESKDTIDTEPAQSCSLRDQDDAHKAQQQL